MPSVQIKTIDNLSILMNKTLSWTSQEKLQQSVKLGSADGVHTIDISDIEKIKLIAVSSSAPFIMGITKDYTFSVVEVEDMFLYTPSKLDRDALQSLSITAINATPTTYEVFVYGEIE